VKEIWTNPKPAVLTPRAAERLLVRLPARLTWKDQRGTTRFASVVTRDVSEFGVFVECRSPLSIPLYRLVQFQLEAHGRDVQGLPQTIRSGRILSAVYRVTPAKTSGETHGIALRLMIDPHRHAAIPAAIRATA
jgi:hypothetical protein